MLQYRCHNKDIAIPISDRIGCTMEFEHVEDFQDFLRDWLEAHGHNVYPQINYSDDKHIDLLTQMYAIACCQAVTQESLLNAAEQLKACAADIAHLKPVIAGLTPTPSPDSDLEALQNSLHQIKDSGVEIWFIDQIPQFVEFYKQQEEPPEDLFAGLHPTAQAQRAWNPWAGVTVALGMATILASSFALAYRILQEPSRNTNSPRDSIAWQGFHDAANVWDLDTAKRNLTLLRRSRNSCNARCAARFQEVIDRKGAEAFRDINPIKRTLNEQEGCTIEVISYDFSP